jgi:hypothetical protein
MRLDRLPLTVDDEKPLPEACEKLIQHADEVLQIFWDRWHRKPIEQYVACDFRYVAASIRSIIDQGLLDGTKFCEWGCGFGIVTGIAWLLGLDAVGIEAEPFLVEQARELLKKENIRAEIWQGNFLPPNADQLAMRQADHPSLFHALPSAYREHDLTLDDFAFIFSYPWPGEEHFLREVFLRYARHGAVMLVFRGPYQIEVYRKIA